MTEIGADKKRTGFHPAHAAAVDLISASVDKILDIFEGKYCSAECYLGRKKSSEISGWNCALCYCPFYNLTVSEGGCTAGNPEETGKWFERPDKTRIWDCGNCDLPHKKESAKRIFLEKLYGIKEKD